jgi:hypothetical protein
MDKMKKIMIAVIVLVIIGIAYMYYKKGIGGLKKLGGSGNAELDKEDNEFTTKLWAEFTARAKETPSWVLDLAIKSYTGESNDTANLDSFYRINGKMLKAGCLFVTLQRGYVPFEFSKLSPADWEALWSMYANWKTQMNLKYQ